MAIIAGKMTEDMSFGDWSGATPDKMREWSEAKLYLCMELGGSKYEPRAQAELNRRQNERLSTLIAALDIGITKVGSEVVKLNASSNKLEKLTQRLNALTWVLIVLTVFAVATPIGIEAWKVYHEHQTVPVAEPPKPAE